MKIVPMEPMLETFNLGNDENSHLTKLSSTLNEQEKRDFKELFTKFQEVFAWSYEDMLDIDPKIAQHRLDTHSYIVPIKQKLRHMRTKWLLKIKEGVTKPLRVGFVKHVLQAEWISNVVPVPKKNGKVRMCLCRL